MESKFFSSGHRICGYLQMATSQSALEAVEATNGRDFEDFHVISSIMAKIAPGSISVPKDSAATKKHTGYLVYVAGKTLPTIMFTVICCYDGWLL